MTESLNEFAKMDEMDGWLENLSEMMVRQDERESAAKKDKQTRQKKIEQTVETAEMKYGRAMTPKTKSREPAEGSKRHGIVDR